MDLYQYLFDINFAYKIGIATELLDGRIPNLTQEMITQFENRTDLSFLPVNDSEGNVCMANDKEVRPEFRQNFSVIDVLGYLYAILYSSNSCSVGEESFGINFQYPKNAETFWKLAELGLQLKQIHSLKKIKSDNFISEFNIKGNCIISNPYFEMYSSKEKNSGRVYINETQYFENVPEAAWIFTVENHQPAKKWLEDRTGQKMNFDEINYYQKILFALIETERLVSKINEIKLG